MLGVQKSIFLTTSSIIQKLKFFCLGIYESSQLANNQLYSQLVWIDIDSAPPIRQAGPHSGCLSQRHSSADTDTPVTARWRLRSASLSLSSPTTVCQGPDDQI